jgi:hypothetical protein
MTRVTMKMVFTDLPDGNSICPRPPVFVERIGHPSVDLPVYGGNIVMLSST